MNDDYRLYVSLLKINFRKDHTDHAIRPTTRLVYCEENVLKRKIKNVKNGFRWLLYCLLFSLYGLWME